MHGSLSRIGTNANAPDVTEPAGRAAEFGRADGNRNAFVSCGNLAGISLCSVVLCRANRNGRPVLARYDRGQRTRFFEQCPG